MKRCASCDREYDSAYDACPSCAKTDAIGNLGNAISGLGAAIMLLGVVAILLICAVASCAS